jgi:hypothetical protein
MYRRTNYTLFPGFVAAAVAATVRAIHDILLVEVRYKRISELYFFIQFARLLDTYLLCFTNTDLECPIMKYSTTYDSLYYIITVVISQIPTRQYEQLAKVLTVYLRPKLFKPKKYQFVIDEVKC